MDLASEHAEDVLGRVQQALSHVGADIRALVEQHRAEVDELRGQLHVLRSKGAADQTTTTRVEEFPHTCLVNLPNSAPNQVEEEDLHVHTVLSSSGRERTTTLKDDPDVITETQPSPTKRVWEATFNDATIALDGVMPGAPPVQTSRRPSLDATMMKRNNREEFRQRMLEALNKEDEEDHAAGLKSAHRHAIMPDASDMKERVRDAISKPEYDVRNFYHTTGWCQKIARSSWFDPVTLAVIGFNAIWSAIDVDFNEAAILSDAEPIFQLMEHSFCAFFVVEWLIRFGSFRRKQDAMKDFWFIFDTALVFFFVLDTWFLTILSALLQLRNRVTLGSTSILRLFRLMRLNRMGRLVRIVRALPEMLVVIKGVVVAVRSVFFTLCLLLVILFVFGVAFRSLTAGTELEKMYFPTVPGTMLALLLGGILAEYEDTARTIGEANAIVGILFGVFMFVATITLMNFLVGVLVEAVRSVSAAEKEQLTVKYVKAHLLELLETSGIDEDKNHRLSRSEYETMLLNPRTAKAMQAMGVDVVGLVDFGDILFLDDNELAFPDFIRLVLQLRGSNPTTVKDIVDLRKFFMQELRDLQENIGLVITELVSSKTTMLEMESEAKARLTRTRSTKNVSTIDKMLVTHTS